MIGSTNSSRYIAPSFNITIGVDIDESVSDPTTACTYPSDLDNATWTPCSNTSAGVFSFNEFATAKIIKDIKPMSFTGSVWAELDKKTERSWSTSIDCFTEIPHCYYSVTKSGNIIKVRLADTKVDDTYVDWAFLGADGTTVRDNTHIGCFYYSGDATAGYSRPGSTPKVSMALNQYWVGASKRGSEYDCLPFQQYLLLQILFLIMFKTRDSQGKFSRGYVDSHSSVTANELFTYNNDFGMAGKAGVDGHMSFFWVHDLWGNMYQFIASIFTRAGSSYTIYQNLGSMAKQSAWYPTSAWNSTSTNATQASMGTTTGSTGKRLGNYYTKACGTNGAGFLVDTSASAGSASTYWPDRGLVGVSSSLATFLSVGGYYDVGDFAGLFYSYVSSNSHSASSYYGSRLSYRGGRA